MTGILKVDTIQKNNGATPTAADLGLNISGSIVQVVRLEDSTVATYNNADFLRLQCSITPKYSNSKILIIHNWWINHINGNGYYRIRRDKSSVIDYIKFITHIEDNYSGGNSMTYELANFISYHEDTPNTTSPVEYGLHYYHYTKNGGTHYWNRPESDTSVGTGNPLRPTSSVTLMEIAA